MPAARSQVYREIQKYTKVVGLTTVAVYGGANLKQQIAELKRGATPRFDGRLRSLNALLGCLATVLLVGCVFGGGWTSV